ncbi:MAG: gamma-glutamylcyclotransferase [Bryobacterales bacterium]|nr:gamma-glutamylcyclotransferase [Bryobacterales bacterium]MBV9398011.1 gamma-glutamylcyclotransferase [Bryobacterales bacterium]
MSSVRHCFRLFVYGTLRRRFRNRHALLLARSSEFIGLGRIRGRLYRLSRYPGIRLDSAENTWIPGEVYRFKNLRFLTALDRYEGPEFERVIGKVARPDGSRLTCWIYQLTAEPSN